MFTLREALTWLNDQFHAKCIVWPDFMMALWSLMESIRRLIGGQLLRGQRGQRGNGDLAGKIAAYSLVQCLTQMVSYPEPFNNIAPTFEAGASVTLLPPAAGVFSRTGIVISDPDAPETFSGTANFGEAGV